MTGTTRLNGAIAELEAGRAVFGMFSTTEPDRLHQRIATAYDVVLFDTEHTHFDPAALRNGLAHLLDRRQIAENATLAPAVTPIIRITANGSEMNQWQAKQALDLGAYGLVWPHISTVAEARNAVSASRYPRPKDAARYDPPGMRGFGPSRAARYWGLPVPEYHRLADVWPLDPFGEILVVIMVEERAAIDNLAEVLDAAPGIGVVLIGAADLAIDLGHLGVGHSDVQAAIAEILGICAAKGVTCGTAGVTAANVVAHLEQGFRFLLTGHGDDDAVAVGKKWVAENLGS
jgi:4-hydroxy-2-oxoheptanedioate aldolase